MRLPLPKTKLTPQVVNRTSLMIKSVNIITREIRSSKIIITLDRRLFFFPSLGKYTEK